MIADVAARLCRLPGPHHRVVEVICSGSSSVRGVPVVQLVRIDAQDDEAMLVRLVLHSASIRGVRPLKTQAFDISYRPSHRPSHHPGIVLDLDVSPTFGDEVWSVEQHCQQRSITIGTRSRTILVAAV
jgi:hypothetical protein